MGHLRRALGKGHPKDPHHVRGRGPRRICSHRDRPSLGESPQARSQELKGGLHPPAEPETLGLHGHRARRLRVSLDRRIGPAGRPPLGQGAQDGAAQIAVGET